MTKTPDRYYFTGKCEEVLAAWPDACVGSVVTDPPYGLSFMGKDWDKALPPIECWQAVYRVLKPGGYMCVFGGTRLFHRLAVALEDAGFVIRDCLMWLYGQGFPKSHDISKAIDKMHGTTKDRVVVGFEPKKKVNAGGKLPSGWEHSKRDPYITEGAHDEAKEWDGWGTALKPAWEPILLVQKPVEKGLTIAKNVLKYGVGGLNINECRIELKEEGEDPRLGGKGSWKTDKAAKNVYEGGYAGDQVGSHAEGRFPANLILEEGEVSQELDKQENNASRFFYQPKANKKERNAGCEDANKHPTVKPMELMRYLIRLVTPEKEVCLDPFVGSGTTVCAAALEKRKAIGIDMNEEYIKIAQERLAYWEDK